MRKGGRKREIVFFSALCPRSVYQKTRWSSKCREIESLRVHGRVPFPGPAAPLPLDICRFNPVEHLPKSKLGPPKRTKGRTSACGGGRRASWLLAGYPGKPTTTCPWPQVQAWTQSVAWNKLEHLPKPLGILGFQFRAIDKEGTHN